MKKFLSLWVCILFVMSSCVTYAVNETRSFELWKRKLTYNDLVYRVGKHMQKENGIKRHYVFEAKGKGITNAGIYTSEVIIVVYSGLMRAMSSDDELAFVIGHELAHKELGHGKYMHRVKRGVLFPARPYLDRKDEKAADIKSIDYMVQAGYDPFAALVVQDRIMNEPDKFFVSKWFLHHPTAKERIVLTGNYIMENYPEMKNGYFASKFREDSVFADLISWDGRLMTRKTANPKLIKELYQGDE